MAALVDTSEAALFDAAAAPFAAGALADPPADTALGKSAAAALLGFLGCLGGL